jgi:hypothetical protein
MEGVRFSEWEDQQAAQAATQVRIEKNKVRIGMTINEVLPLVHGARRSGLIYITADADGAWLFVLPDKKNTFTITPPIFG